MSRDSSIIVRSTSSTAAGSSFDDVPRQVHRLVERREVHDAERLVRGQRRELELDLAEVAERSFGADEQLRHVERAARRHVEVVAGDAPLQLRHARLDLVALARVQRAHLRDELAMALARGGALARARRAVRARTARRTSPSRRSRARSRPRARCAPCCRSAASARRSCCSPSCRRSSPARTSTRRRDTRARAASAAR